MLNLPSVVAERHPVCGVCKQTHPSCEGNVVCDGCWKTLQPLDEVKAAVKLMRLWEKRWLHIAQDKTGFVISVYARDGLGSRCFWARTILDAVNGLPEFDEA